MEVLYILSGVIIGILLSILYLLFLTRWGKPLERNVEQMKNKFKEKGEVFTPDDDIENLEKFLDNLKKE